MAIDASTWSLPDTSWSDLATVLDFGDTNRSRFPGDPITLQMDDILRAQEWAAMPAEDRATITALAIKGSPPGAALLLPSDPRSGGKPVFVPASTGTAPNLQQLFFLVLVILTLMTLDSLQQQPQQLRW